MIAIVSTSAIAASLSFGLVGIFLCHIALGQGTQENPASTPAGHALNWIGGICIAVGIVFFVLL